MHSRFANDLMLGRRDALKALGGVTAGAATLGFAGSASAAAEPRKAGAGKGLDLSNPRDNLYAFGKIWAGYDEPVIGAFHGLMYARIEGKRLMPIFGYVGTGVLQAKVAENGDLLIKSRETGYFTDLETGDILETWDNPFTGETVEVYHFYNDLLGGRITDKIPKFLMGGEGSAATLMNEGTVFPDAKGEYPFLLPFSEAGDLMMLSWDYAHEHVNPVTPEGWPSYSTGARITPSEHFTFNVSRRDVEDRSLPTVRFNAGFTRQSEAWPFMKMGRSPQRNLVLIGRMFSHKGLKGYGEVPRKVLDYVEKHAPEYLTLPKEWPTTNTRIDTWSTFAMDIPPETPGYPWKWANTPRTATQKPPTGMGARYVK